MIMKGKNWARIAYLVIFIISCVMTALMVNNLYTYGLYEITPSGMLPTIINFAMQVVALVLLFNKTSSGWFMKMKGNRSAQPKHGPKDFSFDAPHPSQRHGQQTHSGRQADWARASQEGQEEARRRAEEMRVRHASEEEARRKAEEERAKRRTEEGRARRRAEEESAREEIRKSFDTFELPYSASFDDVKKKYRILLRLFHPDKHSSDSILRGYAEEKTKEINNAFNILKLRHFKV